MSYGNGRRRWNASERLYDGSGLVKHRGFSAMAAREDVEMQGSGLDLLNWPVALCSISILPWLNDLWAHVPTATTVYTAVSAGFMVFQMCDKLGWLDRFKRKKPPTRSKDK